MTLIVVLGILFLICTGLLAASEAAQIKLRDKIGDEKKLQKIWHVSDAINRGIVTGVILYFLFGFTPFAIKGWFFLQFLFWFVFDALLNYFRGKPMLNVGQTSFFDTEIRNIAEEIKWTPELTGLTIKVTGLIIILIIL